MVENGDGFSGIWVLTILPYALWQDLENRSLSEDRNLGQNRDVFKK